MISVAVLIIISFMFFGETGTPRGGRQSDTVFQLYGENVSTTEHRKAMADLAAIRSSGLATLYFRLEQTPTQAAAGQPTRKDQIIHLMLIRREAEKLGIKFSEEATREYVKNLPAFRDRESGQFDSALYVSFLENAKEQLGLSEGDFERLVKDQMALEKIDELLETGLEPSDIAVDDSFQDQNASIAVYQIDVEASKFAANPIEVTDEDVEKHFEAYRDSYTFPEMRSFEYVIFEIPEVREKLKNPTPPPSQTTETVELPATESSDDTAPAEAIDPDLDAESNLGDAAVTEPVDLSNTESPAESEAAPTPDDEEKSDRGGEDEEPGISRQNQSVTSPALADENDSENAINRSFIPAVKSLMSGARQNPDQFTELALAIVKKAEAMGTYTAKYYKSELFERENPPAELEGLTSALESMFAIPAGRQIPQAPSGRVEEGWYLVPRVNQIVPPKQKSYEEAKEQVTEDLIQFRKREALQNAANEVSQKILAALEEGKSIEDASEIANAEAKAWPVFTAKAPPQGIFDYYNPNIRATVTEMAAGQLSDPIEINAERFSLIYVAAREVRINDETEREKARDLTRENLKFENYQISQFGQRDRFGGQIASTLYQDWYREVRDRSNAPASQVAMP